VQAGEEQPPRKRRSPSWGRLIAKVYQVDPLLGTRCGKRMSLIAFITDQVAVGRILDHMDCLRWRFGSVASPSSAAQIERPIGMRARVTRNSGHLLQRVLGAVAVREAHSITPRG
jgi:hypothetical protein